MEQIMNEYEEIYKFKSHMSDWSKDEASSLNNNFEEEENLKDVEYPSLFHDSTSVKSIDFDAKSSLEFGFDLNKYEDEHRSSTPFNLEVPEAQSSSCICAKCQKDIGIGPNSCAKFCQKGNKLTLCMDSCSSSNSLCKDASQSQSCKPIEFEFKLPDSQHEDSFDIRNLDQEFKYIDEWVNALVTSNANNVKDIQVDNELESKTNGRQLENPDQIRNINDNGDDADITVEPVNCGDKLDATFYSCSQNQASTRALEGNVDSSSTKSKGTSDKKFNALSIRRSCFRGLSAYYKKHFSKFNRAWQEKKRNKKKTKDMDALVDTYMRQEFKDVLGSLSQDFLTSLRDALVAILHSHRYKKEEEFTKHIDFSIVRDVLYCYTLEARDRFVKDPAYALIFHHFFVRGGNEFINSQAQSKSKLYAFELNSLNEDSIATLQ